MSDQALSFYDSMADYYHLIFEDWDRSIQRQAKILDTVISRELPDQHLRILDCACGIGTQALGLAARGHHVVGSDISPMEVTRAAREAYARGLNIEFYVSDMTDLKEIPETGFDVVAAFDNALPHLTSDELIHAVRAMASRLNSGGLFIASIRDYDLLLQQKPAMQEPAFFGSKGSRRIVHQVWDWTEAARYTLHLYITIKADQGWTTHHFVSEYRCVRRQELSDALRSVGFEEPVWLMPRESDYHQPLVLARWP
ncbi:class I SAM-dependent methyltransferase [Tunturiibacter empetritectus]|uniref:SAM-dependent methyltransferase n=1 Tax=Tunturiibacter lichenicola TaxID=2051959 RepID=A0A852VMV7_9BACT|nr:class I SAM-dependent methyltransferase [Edaphobacter lichenicola]NYF90906.1 SAM-dependent methyltransferase [Edaphobacter lichenicola]